MWDWRIYKKITVKAQRVVGIDIAPQMIKEAQKRNSAENIEYQLQDFDSIDEKMKYDCIVSIARFICILGILEAT